MNVIFATLSDISTTIRRAATSGRSGGSGSAPTPLRFGRSDHFERIPSVASRSGTIQTEDTNVLERTQPEWFFEYCMVHTASSPREYSLPSQGVPQMYR
jgi:hypothetical protein